MSHLYRITILTILIAVPALVASAQETLPGTPDPAREPAQDEQLPTARIVEGRPALYNFKRALHPLTWIEAGADPVFRSTENGRIKQLMTRTPNPNFAVGVGGVGTGSGLGPTVTLSRKNLFGHGIDVEVPLVYTYSQYQAYQFKVSVPLTSDRLRFDVGTGYSSRAKDDFYGIGNFARAGDYSQYRTVSREASAGLTARLNETWSAGIHAAYKNVGVTKPINGTSSSQNEFRDSSIPGLLTGGALRSAVFSLAHSTEKRDDFQFTGGSEQLEVSRNESAGKGDFAYWKYRLAAQRFFPVSSDGRKVIAARGLVETNVAGNGSSVPFFEMSWLGSAETLRGFDNFRFRDKSAVAATLEYRYRIWPRMDWGWFVDEGRVAPQLGDFDLHHFHTAYGVRLFVWAKPNFPISFDVARSNEKLRVYFNVNANF